MNVYTSTVLFVKATIADPKARVVEGNEKTDVQVFAPDQGKLIKRTALLQDTKYFGL